MVKPRSKKLPVSHSRRGRADYGTEVQKKKPTAPFGAGLTVRGKDPPYRGVFRRPGDTHNPIKVFGMLTKNPKFGTFIATKKIGNIWFYLYLERRSSTEIYEAKLRDRK